ncbi:MAG: DUF1573 domain-containing protein [Cytophagales bacterium]
MVAKIDFRFVIFDSSFVHDSYFAMRSILVLCVVITANHLFAQLAEPVQFVEKVHDFGDVLETKGLAVYDFTFTNKAARPVKILAVQPSCGCTIPDWTKEQVAPGKTGFIRASYNPKDRPGYFDKTIAVTTDLDGNPIVLRIKGNVVNDKSENKDIPYDLVVENGHLLFRNSSFNVGKVYVNREPVAAEFPTHNRGKDTIKILGIIAPPHIKVNLPKKIAPNAKAAIKITYDVRGKNQFGYLSDNIVLKTNDESQPEKSFSVYATAEEAFGSLTPEEQAIAPALKLESYSADLGTVRSGALTERNVSYRNTGKKPLTIRHMQSNCTCLTIQPSSKTLQLGQIANLQFTFNPDGRSGLQNKAITIYSTDPINPVQRLLVRLIIE